MEWSNKININMIRWNYITEYMEELILIIIYIANN